jgi:AraC family transcriptional activator of pobA
MDATGNYLYFSSMPSSRPIRSPARRTPGSHAIPAFFLYGEPLRAPAERLIHVETIAARSALHDWTIRPHRHRDLYQILTLERGLVDASLDGERSRVRGPGLIIVPPGVVHSFAWQPGAVGLVLSFAPGLLAEQPVAATGVEEVLEHASAISLQRRTVRATDLGALGPMLLREFGRSAFGRQPAMRGLLAALLANVLRLSRELRPAPVTGSPAGSLPDRELVARFRRLLKLHYRNHLAIRDYSSRLDVSASRLRRACLAVAGRPPIELLHSRLLIEAERLLRYTTMSIAKVAFHLGFEDPAYFTRFFTRLKRTAPRAFRAADAASGQVVSLP